jgi:hypothetical protein
MNPPGSVLWLQDQHGRFPVFQFEGDTDAFGMGWMSFTSTNRREIVVAEVTASEWNEGASGEARALQRVSEALGRDDLRFVPCLRLEATGESGRVSFQAFRASNARPKPVYAALDRDGEATVECTQSLEAFTKTGGCAHFHSAATQPQATGRASAA